MRNGSEYISAVEYIRKFKEGLYDSLRYILGGMTTVEAKDIILNDPSGDIAKRREAIAVARYVLGEDCTMEQIWRWAEGNVKEVTARVKTCWECTAYVDIDGEQPRCGLDRDPFKCDRKMGGYENGRKEVTKMTKN